MTSIDSRPLDGVRVLDLTRFVAGPYCTMLLGDAGAEVIKIEPPGGEVTRTLDPILSTGSVPISAYFLQHNRNKSSVCLDLRSTDGVEAFLALVRTADVVVENFRPGVMDKLGLGWEVLSSTNPRLVYCSISGFGHSEGPYRDHPAFAILAEVLAGVAVVNPDPSGPPIWTGMGLGDRFPGMTAVSGIAMALYRQQRTGRGGHVDISMLDSMISANERAIALTAMTGEEVRVGQSEFTAPFGLYRAVDGYICIAVIGEAIWARFCQAIGREDLLAMPEMASGTLRATHGPDILNPAIDAWLSDRTRGEAAAILIGAGVPAGPVLIASEVPLDSEVIAREMIVRYPTDAGVEGVSPASPIRVSPAAHPRAEKAPGPGEHTEAILRSADVPEELLSRILGRQLAAAAG